MDMYHIMCAAPGGIGTLASSLESNNTESSSPPVTTTPTPTSTPAATKTGPEDAFSCIAAGSDGSLFTTTRKESSISRMFKPILKFITSSEVHQFLKRAEIHAGLSKTQLFDLFWVLDNLFNVHGGVRLLSSLASKARIVLIIGNCRF